MRCAHRPAISVRGLATALALLAFGPAITGRAEAEEVTALVPAYFYPTWWVGSPWDDLNVAAARIPVEAIMNPASGPGLAPNSDYEVAVAALQASGGKVIGYVSTGYGSRSAEDVLADAMAYLDWYDVDGIFLDEMGNQLGDLDYITVYAAIKALAADAGIELHVVGNPGMPFAQVEAYTAAADTLVIFEGPLTNADPNGASFQLFPNRGPYAGLVAWFYGYPSGRFADLVFGVGGPKKMLTTLLKSLLTNASHVYVTDDVLANPWDTLPAYWDQEVDTIELLNRLLP